MTTLKVCALNQAGIEAFSSWLESPTGEPPFNLLTDPSFTDDLPWAYEIDMSRNFSTTYDLGKYLHSQVFVHVDDPLLIERANGMWAWISLALMPSLLRRSGPSKGKPLAATHYVEANSPRGRRLAYRLICRTAWRLVRIHGERAKIAIGSSRSPWGEMAEQMTSRQEIFSHPSFWAVAHSLYRTDDGNVRRGATSQRPDSARKDPTNSSGKGGVRRLPATFRQFDRTYLTRAMTLEQMLSVLPSEYGKWMKQATA